MLSSQQESVDGIAHPSFTLADIFFFPELALAVYFGLSLQSFPCLSEWPRFDPTIDEMDDANPL